LASVQAKDVNRNGNTTTNETVGNTWIDIRTKMVILGSGINDLVLLKLKKTGGLQWLKFMDNIIISL